MQNTDTLKTSHRTQGYAICLAGTVIWSTTGILIRYLTETYALPSLVLAFWRDLFVTLGLGTALLVIQPALLQPGRKHLPFLLVYGFIVSLFNSTWTVSVALNGAAVATVLAYSAPAFTAVLGWWLLREKLSPLKVGVVIACILGCALVAGAYDPAAWQLNPLGLITGLVSGGLFAAYNLMGKYANQRGLNSWSTLLYAFGIAMLFLLAYNVVPSLASGRGLVGDLGWLGGSLPGWGVLLLLGIGPTIGGYGLYTLSLSYLPMSVASLIATLEPAFTAILAYFLLNEQMAPPQVMGSAVIIGSVLILRLREG